jgi:hypothetical protein
MHMAQWAKYMENEFDYESEAEIISYWVLTF